MKGILGGDVCEVQEVQGRIDVLIG